MKLEEIVEEASKVLKSLVDEYVVVGNNVKEVMIKLARGEVSVVQSWNDLKIVAYLAKDEKMGIYSLNPRRLKEDAEKAANDLKRLERSPLYAPLPEPSGESIDEVDTKIKDAVESGGVSFVIEDLELNEIGDSAGMIKLSMENEILKSSNGADYHTSRTRFNGYVRVFKGDSSGQWSWTSPKYSLSLAKNAIGVARELAEECSKLPRVKFEPGIYRVALGPMVAANLLNEVMRSASAGMVIFGLSFFTGKKPGDVVASDVLSLKDVPRNLELPGFRGYDLEGVGTKDKYVIEKGVFKGFLHNSKTSKLMNSENTGNAGWIIPEPFNIEISEGDLKTDEVIEVLREGYLLTNNWYTRFQNYLEGTFSTVSRDATFKVEGGKLVGCVERVRIADSMPKLLNSIENATKDRWPIEWWEVPVPTLTPYLVLSKARLSAPQ
jgi:PmbA protein